MRDTDVTIHDLNVAIAWLRENEGVEFGEDGNRAEAASCHVVAGWLEREVERREKAQAVAMVKSGLRKQGIVPTKMQVNRVLEKLDGKNP
jgi:hypothetical protein